MGNRTVSRLFGTDGVRGAVDRAGGMPVVAIGGITIANAREVLDTGAASVAVISDLLTGDPRVRAGEWAAFLRERGPLRG